MPEHYKNLLIAGQTLILFVLCGYLFLYKGNPPAPLSAPVAVQPKNDSLPAPDTLANSDHPAPPDRRYDPLSAATAEADAMPRKPTIPADPQAQISKTQQMWQHYLMEPVDYDWSEGYQQQLSDYFVTEAPLHSFKASKIQCRQTSCMLQIKSPDGDTAEQQLKLAHALNPLREQGKIGVYLISQSDGDTVQLMIAKPDEPEQLLH